MAGTTHETLAMSVEPDAGSMPWSTMPAASALAIQRSASARLCFIVVAPPENSTSTSTSGGDRRRLAQREKRRFMTS